MFSRLAVPCLLLVSLSKSKNYNDNDNDYEINYVAGYEDDQDYQNYEEYVDKYAMDETNYYDEIEQDYDDMFDYDDGEDYGYDEDGPTPISERPCPQKIYCHKENRPECIKNMCKILYTDPRTKKCAAMFSNRCMECYPHTQKYPTKTCENRLVEGECKVMCKPIVICNTKTQCKKTWGIQGTFIKCTTEYLDAGSNTCKTKIISNARKSCPLYLPPQRRGQLCFWKFTHGHCDVACKRLPGRHFGHFGHLPGWLGRRK